MVWTALTITDLVNSELMSWYDSRQITDIEFRVE